MYDNKISCYFCLSLVVDSSSKLITGVLYGNLADLGNFDECVSAGGVNVGFSASGDTSTMGFSGRYALVALAIQKAVPGNTTSQKTLTLQLTRNVFLDQPRNTSGVQYTSVLTVHVGACVPSTCTEAVVREALASVAAAVNGRYLNGTAMRLQTDIPKGASAIAGPYREAEFRDLFVISLCVLLLLLLLVGTVLDLTLRTDDKQTRQNAAALLAFSAWTNGRRLLTISPPSDSNFTCINGIRFLSAMWVVMGHRYYAGLQIPFTNFIPFTQRMHDLSFMMVVNALLSVDTFFVMGGMVNCYVIMKVTRGRKSFNWIMYYVHRYIRLTPAFALMVAITATWICLLGTGPLWHKVVIVSSDNCRNNWWASLLYVDIYTDPNHRCMMQTWYLMTDMQMHWLSPLLLYPLYRWRRAGLAWLAFLLVASAIVPAVITYVYELPSPLDLMDTPDKMRFFMEGMYYPPYTRATPYVFGTLMGYGLHLINSGQIKKPVLSRTVILLGWLCSATLCLTVLFSAQPLFDKANHPYNVWEHTVYAGLHRLAWAIGLSWVLMACILGYGGPVNALLSWSPFTVLGRLSYGIYLTHAAVHMVDMGSVRTSSYYSDFNMVRMRLCWATTFQLRLLKSHEH
ncbi:hypothetical protein ONE63_009465 [Megalurothrips usitatus]|uniref:Nose resistant to fluoxetine protein 6-like n=1 Tax=Megalurothrips usitatus TaxID=439358 RepID=A0AAV7XJP6_9NEOP|nr:hypothetical protein ONE63_009465 [Megalurothrips usitatus]